MEYYFRRWDVAAQLMLLSALVYSLIANIEPLVSFYLLTIGWFLISVLVHLFISRGSYKKVYKYYGYVAAAFLVLAGAAYCVPQLVYLVAFMVLYLVPFIVLVYSGTCISEILYLRRLSL